MLIRGLLGPLPLHEVADGSVPLPLGIELNDDVVRHHFRKQGSHVDAVGWKKLHLDRQRLPLEDTVIVGDIAKCQRQNARREGYGDEIFV